MALPNATILSQCKHLAGPAAAFDFAIVASLVGAAASWTRGGHVVPPAGHAVSGETDEGSSVEEAEREHAGAVMRSSLPAVE